MDVAKISAISPRKIDWRTLTAKEIIKYDNEGVAVPVQYLSWAQEFSASLHSEDKTTYEMANSGLATDKPKTQEENTEESEILNSEETSSTNESEAPQTANEYEKTAAETKLDAMIGENKSLTKIGLTFREESKTKESEAKSEISSTEAIEENETNEIANLESYMSSLISEIDNLRLEIENTKGNGDDISQIAKANKLQAEIAKLGNAGQQTLAGSDTELQSFEDIINQSTPTAEEAKDYGRVTVNIGNALKPVSFIGNIIGHSVIKAGEHAISAGKHLTESIASALDTTAQNQATVNSWANEISDKTGVEPIEQAANTNNDEENENVTNNKQQDDKDAAEENGTKINDGTDLNGKLTTDLEAILKRKIRKGENVDNPTA